MLFALGLELILHSSSLRSSLHSHINTSPRNHRSDNYATPQHEHSEERKKKNSQAEGDAELPGRASGIFIPFVSGPLMASVIEVGT